MTETQSPPGDRPVRVRRVLRVVRYVGATLVAAFVLVLLAVYAWLPSLQARHAEIERAVSARVGAPVRIGEVGVHWDGLFPGARLTGVDVLDPASRVVALALPEVRASMAWLPLLWGELRLHRLEFVRPEVALTRLDDGRLQVAGFPPLDSTHGSDEPLRWLFRQHEIVVTGGRLTWIDRKAGESPRTVADVRASLRNSGARHHVAFTGAWPDALCAECGLSIELIGDPLQPSTWGGQLRAKLRGLNLQALPAVARERLPAGVSESSGSADAEVWMQWQQGQPHVASGKAALRDLRLARNAWSQPVAIDGVRGEFNWRRSQRGWNLYVGKTLAGAGDRPWVRGGVYAEQDSDGSALEIEYLDVAAAARLLAGLRGTNGAVNLVRALKPEGQLRHFKLRLNGPWAAPADYEWEADVEGGSIAAYDQFPGFKGVSGRVAMSRAGGGITINRIAGEIDFPQVFKAPLPVTGGGGRLRWKRADDHWELVGEDLRLRNKAGRAQGEFEFRRPFDKRRSPWMRLTAEVPEVSGANVAGFYPVRILPAAVHRWLERFIVSGAFQGVGIKLEGDLRDFPFKQGEGTFEVRGRVRDAVFDYLPRWPRIQKAGAHFLFRGASVLVEGGGHIDGLRVSDLTVAIPDLLARDGAVVHIGGKAAGPVAGALGILRAALKDSPGYQLPSDLTGSGDATLDMKLVVPLRTPERFQVAADYRFERAGLRLAHLRLDDLAGDLQFNEAGVSGGRVRMRALGGDSEIGIATLSDGHVRAEGRGRITGAGLAQAFGRTLGRYVEGGAAWQGSLELAGGASKATLEADLGRLALAVPAPLAKPAGAPLKLAIKTETSDRNAHVLSVHLGDRVAARIALAKHGGDWALARARIHAGEGTAQLPTEGGIHLSVNWPEVEGDAWLDFLKESLGEQGDDANGKAAAWLGGELSRVTLDTGALQLFDRRFGKVGADLARGGNGWSGTMQGDALSGHVFLVPTGGNKVVQLNFDRLVIPRRAGPAREPTPPRPPPRNLPTVSVQCQSFQFGDYPLGRMALWGTPTATGWQINHVVLSRPEMNVFLKGDWLMAPEQQKTDLEAELNTDDIGASLAAFGIRDQIERGKARLTARASWVGGPLDFDLNTVHAVGSVAAEKGQFLKIKQGAGKLLGIFDVNSLVRYLSFDFSTLFGKGFAFDSITGEMSVQQGNALFRTLSIEGSSADIHIAGRAGIAAEDFDLEMAVTPHLRGSLAVIGGLYGGPVGLGTALLLERIWKKQIQKGTRVVYTVQGAWADPVVRRVIKEPNGLGPSRGQ